MSRTTLIYTFTLVLIKDLNGNDLVHPKAYKNLRSQISNLKKEMVSEKSTYLNPLNKLSKSDTNLLKKRMNKKSGRRS